MFAVFWGGSSHSVPYVATDNEKFSSLSEIVDEFLERRESHFYGYHHDATCDVFDYDPSNVSDPYPDRRLTYGENGTVNIDYC